MTSERASRANRRNSENSTGPRTLEGKAKSKQNARKHGLSVVDPNLQLEAEIEHLAELIAGNHRTNAVILEAARSVAEAQVHFQRVQIFKIALLRSGIVDGTLRVAPGQSSLSEIPLEIFVQLDRLDRYEVRALSRRKFAVRKFLALVNREFGS